MYEALRSITSVHHEPLHTIERIEMLRFRRFFVLFINLWAETALHCCVQLGREEKLK